VFYLKNVNNRFDYNRIKFLYKESLATFSKKVVVQLLRFFNMFSLLVYNMINLDPRQGPIILE